MAPFGTESLPGDLTHRITRAAVMRKAKADEFRARAAECDEKADQAKDVEAKRMFREAAANWRSMAAQAERHEW
jgi:hypothetical protein